MFKDILRVLREEKGIGQKDMAEHLSISRQAYNYYELGKREPSYDTLKVLAEYFNVTTDYLLGVSDNRSQITPVASDETLRPQDVEGLSEESKKELDSYLQLLRIRDQVDKSKEEQSSALEKRA